MARKSEGTSRIEILILSSLARLPMHGYELKTELRYRHVKWWAKLEHGHLYAALARLEKKGDIRPTRAGDGSRGRRVYQVTAQGRRRVERELEGMGLALDETYFDVDLFLSGSFVLPQKRVVDILVERAKRLRAQLDEAHQLRRAMGDLVPTAGRLIIEHRVEHLEREMAFAENAAKELRAMRSWGPFLGRERIGEFVARTSVPLELPVEARAGSRRRG